MTKEENKIKLKKKKKKEENVGFVLKKGRNESIGRYRLYTCH